MIFASKETTANAFRTACLPSASPAIHRIYPTMGDSIVFFPSGSLGYRRIKSLLFWDCTPFWDVFAPYKLFLWAGTMVGPTSNSSNTDVVEKVTFLVAASRHGGTSVAEGSP